MTRRQTKHSAAAQVAKVAPYLPRLQRLRGVQLQGRGLVAPVVGKELYDGGHERNAGHQCRVVSAVHPRVEDERRQVQGLLHVVPVPPSDVRPQAIPGARCDVRQRNDSTITTRSHTQQRWQVRGAGQDTDDQTMSARHNRLSGMLNTTICTRG